MCLGRNNSISVAKKNKKGEKCKNLKTHKKKLFMSFPVFVGSKRKEVLKELMAQVSKT